MKTFNKTKFVALIVGIFIVSAFVARAVFQPSFSGPSSINPPQYGTVGSSEMNMNANTQDYIDPIGSTLSVLGRSLAITSINEIGLITDGVFSFGPIRAIGKLTATLLPTSVSGNDAKEVMHLKGGRDSAVVSFLTNTSYLGFWGSAYFFPGGTFVSYPEPYPQFVDTIGLNNSIYDKMITNLLFGRVNIKNLVVSPTLPYTQTNSQLTLYGTTNLGHGPVCFIPANYTLGTPYANVQYKCPSGWMMKSPGLTSVYHPSQLTNTTATINGVTVNIPANTPVYVCQRISPVSIPGSNSVGSTYTGSSGYYYNASNFEWCNSSGTGTQPPPPPPPPATGSLTVTITPAGAITAGAKWQLDGAGTLRNSGVTVTGISLGSHFVKCTAVTGYTTPPNQNVTISAGVNTTASCNYTAVVVPPTTGSVTVTMTPQAANAAGAKWQLDGTGTSYNSGQTITGVTAGSHFIKYSSLFPTYTTPANSNITVPAGGSTTATGNYVLAPYDIVQQIAYIKNSPAPFNDFKLKLCLNPAKYSSGAMNTANRTVTLHSHWINNNPPLSLWLPLPWHGSITIPAGQLCATSLPFYLVSMGTMGGNPQYFSSFSTWSWPTNYMKPDFMAWTISTFSSGLTVDPNFTGH